MLSGEYQYIQLKKIFFGKKMTEVLQELMTQMSARSIFVIISQHLVDQTDVLAQLRSIMGDRHLEVYTKIHAQTPRIDVIAATDAARRVNVDLILTIGGGSMTDAGKMVMLCLSNNITKAEELDRLRPILDYKGGLIIPKIQPANIPLVCIPTTLAAAEYSNIAGVTDTVRHLKETFKDESMCPSFVILDPWLSANTPEWLFLSTGIRALDHAVETLCSTKPTPISDATSIHALKLLAKYLPALKNDASNIEARGQCQVAAWLSMTGIQSGVPVGASHAIGHELGGTAGVPHGYTSCIMLPHVLRFNESVNSDKQKLISEAFGELDQPAADIIADFIKNLGLPSRLRDVNVRKEILDEIAEKTMVDPWIYSNPRQIKSAKDICLLLEEAW